MREKRMPIQNLIKILYVFWTTLLLSSCTEEKGFIENNPKNKYSIKEYNWNEANKIMKFKESQSKVINSLKSKDNNATSRQILGFEVDENLVKEISSEDYTSYNMLIIREQQSQEYFENLVIEIKGDTTNAYLVKYIPSPENSSAENNLNGDFNGEIETSKVYGQTCFVCPEDVSNPDASGIGIGLGGATSICVTMYKCYTPDPSLPNLSIPHISYCGDCEQIPFSSCSGSASPLGSSNPSTGSNVGPGNGAMHGGSGTNNTTTNPINNPIVTPVAPTLTQIIDSFGLSLSSQEQLWWNNPVNTDLVNQIKAFLAKKFPNITLEDFEFANQLVSDYMNNIINPIASNIPLINISLANQITDIIDYLKCFDPTQPAVFTLYVDQPTANSNTPWSGNPLSPDVGHTFISIKQGTIRRVLGFYPSSSVDLNNPSVTGVCENNSNHTFDVSLSLNITTTQLKNILSYIKFKSASTYNLNTANCTDFGMGAIKLAGIDIPSAYGTWGAPGVGSGAGDNPGQLGQNIRNMPVANNVVKTTSTGNAQSNMGTCP